MQYDVIIPKTDKLIIRGDYYVTTIIIRGTTIEGSTTSTGMTLSGNMACVTVAVNDSSFKHEQSTTSSLSAPFSPPYVHRTT